MIHAPISPPYANVREAYQHLLQYDSAPTLPKLKGNYPVTLFVRDGYIYFRTYESFEAITRFMNSSIFKRNVIVNVEHFKSMYRELQVRKMYRMITGERFQQDDPRDVYKVVWMIFQMVPVTKMKAVTGRRHGNAYLFDLNKIKETDIKFPKQCQVIMTMLVAKERSSYTLDELKILANDLHKFGLKTKQPPFKILQYYLPQLFDAGLVEYPRKQYDGDEGTDDEQE